MKISIIIPMYNSEKYIKACLDSLISQTYKNFEVVIIDDGSTDSSCEIVEMYSKKDSRFMLYNQENTGASSARNKGISLSRGDLIYFLDSDDYILKNTLETCVNALIKNKVDLVIFDAQCIYEEEYKIKRGLNYIQSMKSYYDRSEFLPAYQIMTASDFLSFSRNKFRGNTVFCFFKRELLDNEINFSRKLCYFEDFMFLYKLLKKVESIIYIPEQFYCRRLSGESLITSDDNEEKVLYNVLECLDELNAGIKGYHEEYFHEVFMEIAAKYIKKVNKSKINDIIRSKQRPYNFQLGMLMTCSNYSLERVNEYKEGIKKINTLLLEKGY